MFPCPTDVIRKLKVFLLPKVKRNLLSQRKTEEYNQKEEEKVAALLMLLQVKI